MEANINYGRRLEEAEIKYFAKMILQGINHCHSHGIMHRVFSLLWNDKKKKKELYFSLELDNVE